MAYLSYIFFRILVFIFQLIPFWLLYRISDGLRWVIGSVFKYRRGLIEQNLRLCFPEKNDAEIQKLIRGVYANFCDILLEGIKGMGMDEYDIAPRFKVVNPDVMNAYFEQGQDVILCASHYANWEWGISLGTQFRHYVKVTYKPIKNQYINHYVERSRAFDNLSTVPMKKTYDYLQSPAIKPRCLILIADQSPSSLRKAHWHTFLNRDTAFLSGIDTIGRQFDMSLIYADVQRIKRGYYEIELSLLHDTPAQTQVSDITQLYAKKLETIIRKKPENWLWTHNRWKRKR